MTTTTHPAPGRVAARPFVPPFRSPASLGGSGSASVETDALLKRLRTSRGSAPSRDTAVGRAFVPRPLPVRSPEIEPQLRRVEPSAPAEEQIVNPDVLPRNPADSNAQAPSGVSETSAPITLARQAPTTVLKTSTILLLIAVGVVFVLLLFALIMQTRVDVGQVGQRVDRVESGNRNRDAVIKRFQADQGAAMTELATKFAEVRRPPSKFLNAQDLFQVGKYADAEAIYGALLVERPTSALVPVILGNSALANAMLGNCSMVQARLNQMKKLTQGDALLRRTTQLLEECANRRKALRHD